MLLVICILPTADLCNTKESHGASCRLGNEDLNLRKAPHNLMPIRPSNLGHTPYKSLAIQLIISSSIWALAMQSY